MFTLLRRILCLVIIGAFAFVAVALWSGGEKFRKIGRETGGAVQKGSERLAEKADRIKEKKDATTSTIKKWTGKGSPGQTEETPGGRDRAGQKKETKDTGVEDEKTPGKKDAEEEEKGFFRGLMETAWGKIKKLVREKVSDDERPHKN
ncbi:MAG: hypothetical protein K8I29_10470 [Alphaproteobacteria bacterium]|uniref:Uncharacterized protein n=1 Tax=Candidatus Nitrobium versatile TaxID=2884831 RepID=A0A953JBP5_9BACT|nr:hypothetical protein [Candidatus Nitrobium versatile]